MHVNTVATSSGYRRGVDDRTIITDIDQIPIIQEFCHFLA